MTFNIRSAWREQWLLIILAIALFLLPFLPWFGTSAPLDNLKMTALLAAPFLIVGLIIIVRHYSWRFTVNGDIIQSHRGIIAREVRAIRVEDLRNINVKQTLFHRLIGIGDVEFSSAGSSGVEVVFKGVSQPMALMRKIQNA
ncbi:PH domain-containing protein [candidate division KSB1 bacterium]|nr:MAG: PH domain-containing protein [candidate division KSB1 bacterium]MCE7945782.1 PH domain-containing protein [Chlorobi bacterium CHB1]MDL1879305.1 PH domain-containing protein [Cytophagia bacterium CHB2]RIK73574.1 MAG: hypothetical protein DCC62_17085 [candidate division KSB1 bacterium]